MASLEEILKSVQESSGEEDVLKAIFATDSRELGKMVNPGAEDIGGFTKFMKSAFERKGIRGLFGQDATDLGNQIKETLATSLLASEVENKITSKRKRDQQLTSAKDLLDIDGDGNITFGELSPGHQRELQARGQAPTKLGDPISAFDVPLPDHIAQFVKDRGLSLSEDIQGPTQPLSKEVLLAQTSGDLVKDEFGGTFTSIPSSLPTDFADQAFSKHGSLLTDALTRSTPDGHRPGLENPIPASSSHVEMLLREADPGLQPPMLETLVNDPDALVSDALVRQLGIATQTDLQTPRQQAQLVSPQDANEVFNAVESAAGMPLGTLERPRVPLPASTFNNMVNNAQAAFSKSSDMNAREQRQKAHFNQQEKMFDLKADLSRELQDSSQQFSMKSALTLKQVAFENQQALEDGRATRRETFAREQARQRFSERLNILEKKHEFEGTQNQLNRDAALARSVFNGSVKMQAEHLRSLNNVALADHKNALERGQKLEEFYLDFMKSNPAIAGDFAEILANTPPGTLDPLGEKALRDALNKQFKKTVDTNLVQQVLDNTVLTDMFAQTSEEKEEALYLQMKRLESQGVDVSAIQDQLDFMKATKGSSRDVNVSVHTGLPKTAGEREDISGFRQILANLEYIGTLYKPEFVGPLDDMIARAGSNFGFTGISEERFRAAVAEIKSTIAKMRAGGAIGPAEERFLLDAIPGLDIPQSTFGARWANFYRVTQGLLTDRYSMLGMSARERSDELERAGKGPAEIERVLIREGLLPRRSNKKGGR